MKATWSAGDFGKIAEIIQAGADAFIERLNITPGETVLNVACGTGNLSLTSAKGAKVTGINLRPTLSSKLTARAAAEGLTCKFEEGDAEDMPYTDDSFDTVITMFGAMSRPASGENRSRTAARLPAGGRLVMANWTPQHFVGQMFKTGAEARPAAARYTTAGPLGRRDHSERAIGPGRQPS